MHRPYLLLVHRKDVALCLQAASIIQVLNILYEHGAFSGT
jgi:hypothetical protein